MAASREVRSLLDYAARQSDKLVAYPDLVNATGPDYPEPFYTRILSNNEGEKHQAMVPQGDSAPLGKSSTEGLSAPRPPWRDCEEVKVTGAWKIAFLKNLWF